MRGDGGSPGGEARDGDGTRLARVTYLPGAEPRVEPGAEPGIGSGAEPPSGPRDRRRAANIATSAIARRGLSRREVERLLRDRGLDEPAIADELARLERLGWVDDSAVAQTLVGTLQERKGLGRTAIAAELARRMFAPAAIEYALELVDSGDELARAHELARRRAGQLHGLDRDTAARRLSAYLQRRGYGGSTIRAAVDRALPRQAASS